MTPPALPSNRDMIPKTIIHLLSGGLDSVTMLYDLVCQRHNVHCLIFDYGQAHKRELDFAHRHVFLAGVLYTCVKLPNLGGLTEDNWIVPNRNAIFLSVAVNLAIKAKADTITIGCNSDDADYFPDCRKPFIDSMNSAVKAAGYDIEICAPYLEMPKWKIGAMARERGITAADIWACYHGGKEPCGKCPACLKLAGAMP